LSLWQWQKVQTLPRQTRLIEANQQNGLRPVLSVSRLQYPVFS
jgi:hypothetical protein